MIKLICLNDPSGISGRIEKDFPAGMTATEILMQVFPDGLDKYACSICINDVATVVGESPWLFQPLNDGDVVLFKNEPKGFSLLAVAVIALASAAAAIYLTPKPQIPGDMGSIKQSPNNTLQGQTNIARPYQGLADIYGNPTAFPDLGGEAVVFYQDNKKFVKQFMSLGIGSFDVPPLNAGSSLLSNFEGATQEVIEPESKSETYTSTITAYTPNSGNDFNLEVTLQGFGDFAINSEIIISNFIVTPIISGDDLDLSGLYEVENITAFNDGGTVRNRMKLKEPENVNANWTVLNDSRGSEADSTFSTPVITTANPEAIATNEYSFAINEVDGQEVLAANQGADGLTASTNSLVTDISYTEGNDFTFSVLSSSDWDDIKTDFDASAVDYFVLVEYQYSKYFFPGSYALVDASGGGALTSMTLVPDVGGDYYDVVISDFDGLASEGGSPAYGQQVTVTERIGEIIGPFVTPLECDRLRFNVTFPQGLKWTDIFEVETNQCDQDGVIVGGTTEVDTFTIGANTLDPQFRSLNTQPSYGRSYYSVSIRRIDNSPNSTSKPDLAKLESLNCIIDDVARNFGNVTLLKVTMPATINATSLRENQINVDATRKTITYNTTTQQVDYTLTASRRFADALLHEYVMVFKRDPATLDLDGLYEIQERIDAVNPELGEFVYTFDDLDISLDQRMTTILNVARCFKWLDGDVYRFGRDEKQDFIGNVITQRDIAAADERDYSNQYLSSMPSDYDSIKFEYVDRTTNKKAYIYRRISDGEIQNSAGLRPDTFTLSGCYSKAQAEDRADLEIRKVIYNRFIVTETCLSQCSLLDKGQAVRYADQYNYSTHDGEIIAISGDIAYTSNGIEWDGVSSYFVDFKDEYNNVYRSAVEEVTGNTKAFRALTSGILTNAYLPKGTEQLGSVYVIGASSDLEASAWTVTEKKPANNGNVTLTLTNYDERVFEKDVV